MCVNGAAEFQDDECFSVAERYWHSGVGHDVDFHGVEILLLQWDVQYWVQSLMHVSVRFIGLVDYAEQRCFRVSDGNVLQYVAVDVGGTNVPAVRDVERFAVTVRRYFTYSSKPSMRATSRLNSMTMFSCNFIDILPLT